MTKSVRHRSGALQAILATAAIAISVTACASDDTGTLRDPNVVAKLHDLGLGVSTYAGVPSPTSMYAVSVSDHQAAETALSGAIINDHVPVFVIVMTGGPFTAMEAPPGVAFPQGDVLTATVNAATYEITDVGIVNEEPDLSKVASDTVDLIGK